MRLLVTSFNPSTLPNLMCGNLISVAYDGRIFDCDFNQQMDIPLREKDGQFNLKRISIEKKAMVDCRVCLTTV